MTDFASEVLPLAAPLYGAALRFVRDPDDAADLVQDSMVRAHRSWDRFDGRDVRAWMFTILRNTFINGYHRDRRRREGQERLKGDAGSAGPSVAAMGSAAQGQGQALEAADTIVRVREAIASLPPKYRRAVTLCDLLGMSYQEIADELDCPIGTVMSRLYRGRGLLRDALSDHARDLGIVDAA